MNPTYAELLAENESLKQQITHLKSQLSKLTQPKTQTPPTTKIHNKSTPIEKIDLFKTLFQGRTDIHAKRWQSIKTGKSGYQPVCQNEWNEQFCDKKKYKCNACQNRKLSPLTDEIIYKHLHGKDEFCRDVVGIYPLLTDETCLFLAVDFDDGEFRFDVLAFKNACVDNKIDVYIELSRSGNGAHAWIFFEENISAKTARQLGSGLLTYAMNKRSEIKFDSYDRLFPNQDIMPSGGFGNLLALPLQGRARKQGKSVFVDDDFEPFDDQWAYLSQIKKMNKTHVEAVANKLCKNSDLGILVKENGEQKPWESRKKEEQLTLIDFPNTPIKIIKSNMLFIEKQGLSQRVLTQIKRLGAFKNPDFYKAQAMRLPTYNKPRIISTIEENGEYIGLPRGCEKTIISMLVESEAMYEIEDKTNAGEKIKVTFNGTLRENQAPAVDALLKHNNGVLSATTAFGKTVVAANIIAQRKTNTLILVHTQALLSQWKKSLTEFLSFDVLLPELPARRGRKRINSIIGELCSGKNQLNGIVDIALMQSLVSGEDVKELVRNYGQIIVDECHHVSAVNFEKILKFANAKYVIGLTATPTRQDGHDLIIFLQCGEIRYKVDAKTEAEKRPFEHFIIPRFTSLRLSSLKDSDNIAQIYSSLSENKTRNNLIVEDVKKSLEKGRNPIILTERTKHIEVLAELLSDECETIITLSGRMSTKEKKLANERLESLRINEKFIIIASGKYVGEGFDFPRLDTLFLAMPIAWKGKVAQYAGRLSRIYEGKTDVQIYDYVDLHVPVLEKMYHKRVKSYAAIGYKTKQENLEFQNTKTNLIYSEKTYQDVYLNDIQNDKNEIVISSPYMTKSRLTYLLTKLTAPILNGSIVTIITKSPDKNDSAKTEKFNELVRLINSANIKLVVCEKLSQKFSIIDQNIVWYGSVNFLAYNRSDESVMRLDSLELGEELLDSCNN